MLAASRRFLTARSALRARFDPAANFGALEESCIPSYTHANILMGWVAWRRLDAAVALFRRHGTGDRILDYGAGSGVLRSLLPSRSRYHFAEIDEVLAARLAEADPAATRVRQEDLRSARFDAVFALDSLEHADDAAPLLDDIAQALAPNGVFILSGPTENALYRLGRRLAGFDGHYHVQTVYDIERMAQRRLRRLAVTSVPFGLPLFRISVWQRA